LELKRERRKPGKSSRVSMCTFVLVKQVKLSLEAVGVEEREEEAWHVAPQVSVLVLLLTPE
jgi:hypothetical protein